MEYTTLDKLKALAIVNVFETSKPFGDYAACVVLNDGAGVSYGINQFTHRSGSLLAVVRAYLANDGRIGRKVLEANLLRLQSTSARSIKLAAADRGFRTALKAAASSPEMHSAQNRIAFERYLNPAIEICGRLGFHLPLSLAVIYDSVNHGSWELIRDRVKNLTSEKEWITEYVRQRDKWLSGITRLRSTRYRTRFFLDQIATGRWHLDLPLMVKGVRLSSELFTQLSAVGPIDPPTEAQAERTSPAVPDPQEFPPRSTVQPPIKAQPPIKKEESSRLETIEGRIADAAEKYDRFERSVTAVVTRKDSAKSLWTAVAAPIWQSFWALFAFLVGLPREIWLFVAVIAAAFGLFYLYRQIALGKIRELPRR